MWNRNPRLHQEENEKSTQVYIEVREREREDGQNYDNAIRPLLGPFSQTPPQVGA